MEEGRNMVPAGRSDGAAGGELENRSESGPNLPSARDQVQEDDVLGFEPVAMRERTDGWSPFKQREFIEALADCGVVHKAAAHVGMTPQSARRLRRRADGAAFARAWRAALRFGAENLRSVAYDRAVTGTVKSYFYRGEKVGEDVIYDHRLLMFLIGKAEQGAGPEESQEEAETWGDLMDAIEDGVEAPSALPGQGEKSRAWQDTERAWWTDFLPPPGFEGEQCGEPGHYGYRRQLTPLERKAIRTMQAREDAEDGRRRELYFARVRGFFIPMQCEL